MLRDLRIINFIFYRKSSRIFTLVKIPNCWQYLTHDSEERLLADTVKHVKHDLPWPGNEIFMMWLLLLKYFHHHCYMTAMTEWCLYCLYKSEYRLWRWEIVVMSGVALWVLGVSGWLSLCIHRYSLPDSVSVLTQSVRLLGIFIFLNCKLCLHSIIGNQRRMPAQSSVEAPVFYKLIVLDIMT